MSGVDRADPIDLLVVGEINPDVVVSAADPHPEFGQVERFVDGIRLVIGSSSAITACAAARLGLRVAIVGVVGDDATGRFMLGALGDRGIDTSACRVDRDRPTGASVILSDGHDRAILTALGTIGEVRAADVPADLLARARHVHVGAYFLQRALAPELPALFRAARAAGATTSVDPNWDPANEWDGGFLEAAGEADVLLPNAGEARRLTGEDDVVAAARALATRGHGARTVVVKLGADGALAIGPGGGLVRATAAPVRAVDTTGAGDSFNGGFLAAWLERRPLEECVRFAVACGTLSTLGLGGTEAQPTRDEVEAALGGATT